MTRGTPNERVLRSYWSRYPDAGWGGRDPVALAARLSDLKASGLDRDEVGELRVKKGVSPDKLMFLAKDKRLRRLQRGGPVGGLMKGAGFVPGLRAIAQGYNREAGLPRMQEQMLHPLHPEFGLQTALAYEGMPMGPDALSRRAYAAFGSETAQQYEYLQRAGFRFEPDPGDPYHPTGSMTKMQLAAQDVAQNKRLLAFSSSLEHPLLTNEQNLQFRHVHDMMGHLTEGFSIGPRGEFNAAIKHSQMYSPLAQMAMLAETHGQNSVVNFSPTMAPGYGRSIAEVNRGAPGTLYAEQKAQVLPADIMREFYKLTGIKRRYRGGPAFSEVFPRGNIDLSAYSRRDRLEAGRQLYKLGLQFPYTASRLVGVKAISDPDMRKAVMATYGTPGRTKGMAGLTKGSPRAEDRISAILLNAGMGASDIAKIGGLPRSIADLVTHEFGHAIDYAHGRYVDEPYGASELAALPRPNQYGTSPQEKFAEVFVQSQRGVPGPRRLFRNIMGVEERVHERTGGFKTGRNDPDLFAKLGIPYRQHGGPVGLGSAGLYGGSPEALEAAAIGHFGVTDDIREAGFLTPMGRYLDFSGRHQSESYLRQGDRWVPKPKGGPVDPLYGHLAGKDYLVGQRSIDHNESNALFPGLSRVESVDRMKEMGFIRVWGTPSHVGTTDLHTVGAEMARVPTSAQTSRLVGAARDALHASLDVYDTMGYRLPGGSFRTEYPEDPIGGKRMGSFLRQGTEMIQKREAELELLRQTVRLDPRAPHRAHGGPAGKGGLPKGMKILFSSNGSVLGPRDLKDLVARRDIEDMTSLMATVHDRSGRRIAEAPFRYIASEDAWHPIMTSVEPHHRRKGLATAMYVKTERLTGRPVMPSDSQLLRGEALWAQEDRPFGKRFGERGMSPAALARAEHYNVMDLLPGGMGLFRVARGGADPNDILGKIGQFPGRQKGGPATTTEAFHSELPEELQRVILAGREKVVGRFPKMAETVLHAGPYTPPEGYHDATAFYQSQMSSTEFRELIEGKKYDTIREMIARGNAGPPRITFNPKYVNLSRYDEAGNARQNYGKPAWEDSLGKTVLHEYGHDFMHRIGQQGFAINEFNATALRQPPFSPYPGREVGDYFNLLVRRNVAAGQSHDIDRMMRESIFRGMGENQAEIFASVMARRVPDWVKGFEPDERYLAGNWLPSISGGGDSMLERMFGRDHRGVGGTYPEVGIHQSKKDLMFAMRQLMANAGPRMRAAGGDSSAGMYIAGELGRELFVPAAMSGLIPADVMAQIPQRQSGGMVEIPSGPLLWQAPEDGWIIPNHLMNKVPRAAGGSSPREPGTTIKSRQRIAAEEEARRQFLREQLATRTDAEIEAEERQNQIRMAQVGKAQYGGRTPRQRIGAQFDYRFGGGKARAEALVGAQVLQRQLGQRAPQEATAAAIEESARKVELFRTEADKFGARVAGGTGTAAALRKAGEAHAFYSDQLKTEEANLKFLREEHAKTGAMATKEAELAAKATGAVGQSLVSVAAGGAAFTIGMEAINTAVSASIKVLAPLADQLTGFGAKSQQVTKSLAEGVPEAGRVGTVLARAGVSAGLSAPALGFVEQRLGGSIQAKAGGAAAGQASDLFRAAIGFRAPEGLQGGYGGLFGGSFAAEQLGGGKGFEQIIAGDIAAAGALKPVLSELTGMEQARLTAQQAMPGYNPEAVGAETIVPRFERTDAAALEKMVENFNAATGRGTQQGGAPAFGMKDVGVDAAKQVLEIPGISEFTKQLAQTGVVYTNAAGDIVKSNDEIVRGLGTAALGFTLPDPEVYAKASADALRGAAAGASERGQFERGIAIPGQIGQQITANPFIAATAGIEANFKSAIAPLGETQKMQDELTQSAKDSITAQKAFIDQNAGRTEGAEFQTQMDDVAKYGEQIAKLNTVLANKQAALGAQQYGNSLRLINRSIADARGLQTGVGGPQNLGAIERQQYEVGRESQQLGFQMTQKQINFQKAVAGFQAPGITGQERAARMQEAEIEADYQQKQLNLAKKGFGLEGQSFEETARRGPEDLAAQKSILVESHAVEQEQLSVQKRLVVLSAKQEGAQGKAISLFNQATGNFDNKLSVATDYVKMFSGSMQEADTKIREILGLTPREKEQKTPGAGGHAAGIIGLTSGPHAAMMGEAGTEAVAILRNPRPADLGMGGGMGGGGGGTVVHITITGNTISSEQDLEQLAQRLTAAVEERLGTKANLLGSRAS